MMDSVEGMNDFTRGAGIWADRRLTFGRGHSPTRPPCRLITVSADPADTPPSRFLVKVFSHLTTVTVYASYQLPQCTDRDCQATTVAQGVDRYGNNAQTGHDTHTHIARFVPCVPRPGSCAPSRVHRIHVSSSSSSASRRAASSTSLRTAALAAAHGRRASASTCASSIGGRYQSPALAASLPTSAA